MGLAVHIGNRFVLSTRYRLMMSVDYSYQSTRKDLGYVSRELNPVTVNLTKQFNGWDMSLYARFDTVKNASARWNKTEDLYYYVTPRRPFHNIILSVRYIFGKPVKVPYDRSHTELDDM